MENVTVRSNTALTGEIFMLELATESIAKEARPGQFVSVYCNDGSRLLPRPISICRADADTGRLYLVIRRGGKGTAELAKLEEGDRIDILGPLGNGFPAEEAEGKRALLVGGGVGIPPLVFLAESLNAEKTAVLGYRSSETFLCDEMKAAAGTFLATEDGSLGVKGNVLDCIRQENIEADIIYACGPTPMLRALKAYAAEKNIPCYLSLEERMACGVGACLACVCKASAPDPHFGTPTRRICADGPVFEAKEIEL